MADKKITELTELTALADEDLFVVVDAPTGTAITKKIVARNIWSNGINLVTTSTINAISLLKSALTVNVSANTASGNTVVAGDFSVNTLAAATDVHHQYGIRAKSALAAAAANVTIEHASAKFELDTGAAGVLIANTHGVIIRIGNSATRTTNVTSFLRVEDQAANSTSAQTLYLLDANNVSSDVTTNSITTILTKNGTGTTSNERYIKVRINGTDLWLMARTSPA